MVTCTPVHLLTCSPVQVGKQHDFSAGLVIGGKDLKYEWSRVGECNILVCTPGRLLQVHMPYHLLTT